MQAKVENRYHTSLNHYRQLYQTITWRSPTLWILMAAYLGVSVYLFMLDPSPFVPVVLAAFCAAVFAMRWGQGRLAAKRLWERDLSAQLDQVGVELCHRFDGYEAVLTNLNTGAEYRMPYRDIKKVTRGKDLTLIKMKTSRCLVLRHDSYILGSEEQLFDLIQKKRPDLKLTASKGAREA